MKLENTGLQLSRQVECARQAGIYDAMFLAFGGLLGYVRHGGFLPGDDDLDVGFHSEMITAEQEAEFHRLLGEPCDSFPHEHGLFEYRSQATYREDNDRRFWISIRGMPVDDCYKCCHWFFWESHGYTWHSKGRGSLVKGIPSAAIEVGPEVEFMGATIRIPKHTGTALDFWYSDWWKPRAGGNSAKKVLFKVNDWKLMSGDVTVT